MYAAQGCSLIWNRPARQLVRSSGLLAQTPDMTSETSRQISAVFQLTVSAQVRIDDRLGRSMDREQLAQGGFGYNEASGGG
jgi:hypothetical protein